MNIKQFIVDKNNSDIPSKYYNYDLQGIIIHFGTAQYGHYYSLIKRVYIGSSAYMLIY